MGDRMAEKRDSKPKQAKRAATSNRKGPAAAPVTEAPATTPPVPAPVIPSTSHIPESPVPGSAVSEEPVPEAVAPAADPAPHAPRLYLMHPLLVGALPAWDAALERAASLGFNAVLVAPPFATGGTGNLYQVGDPDVPHPVLEAPGDSAAMLETLAGKAKAHGLALYLDLVLDRVAADGRLAASQPGWFGPQAIGGTPDPRLAPPDRDTVHARWEDPEVAEALGAWWEERLRRFAAAGIAGFRCDAPARLPATVWRRLIAAVPEASFLAWTAGLPADELPRLAGAGFAGVFDSLAWWDLRGEWLAEEATRLAAIAPAIATVEPPFGPRLAARDPEPVLAERAAIRHLRIAAATGAGMLVPMGFEYGARRPMDAARDRPGDWEWIVSHAPFDLSAEIRAANAAMAARTLAPAELRPLSGPGAPAMALLRAAGPDARTAQGAVLLLANPDLRRAATVSVSALLPGAGGAFTRFTPCWPAEGAPLAPGAALLLQPGEARVLEAEAPRPIRGAELAGAEAACRAPRIAIEAIDPLVDGGRFPVKRTVGEIVEVGCDLICDGHEKLGAALLWRAADETAWQEARMRPLGNDRWTASFPLERIGPLHLRGRGLARCLRHLPRRAGEEARGRRADIAGAGGRPPAGGRRRRAHPAVRSPSWRSASPRRGRPSGWHLLIDRRRPPSSWPAADERRLPHRAAPRSRWTPSAPARASPAGTSCSRAQPAGRSGAARHLRRRHRAAAAHPRHGLRRAVFPADPSDRQDEPQGSQQHADAGAGRSGQPLCDRLGGWRA